MNCQYYDNNFETCTNGDCPFCSDFCPVTENQEICRYSGLDETETMLRNCLDNEERESRETIQALAEENQELKKYQELGDYDRLRELAQADRDGRCVVVPVKLGQPVYCLQDYFNDATMKSEKRVKCRLVDFMPAASKMFETNGLIYQFSEIGKTVFLTREEAEAKLKEREKNG